MAGFGRHPASGPSLQNTSVMPDSVPTGVGIGHGLVWETLMRMVGIKQCWDNVLIPVLDISIVSWGAWDIGAYALMRVYRLRLKQPKQSRRLHH